MVTRVQRRTSIWRAALLVLGSLVVTFTVLEIAFRFVVPRASETDMYVRSDDELLNVELRPGADFEFEGVAVTLPATRVIISSRGLRERELVVPKPSDVLRIGCLGDSFTFGWGVEVDEAWCRQLEGRLGRVGGRRVETVNLGVPGYNPSQQIRFLQKKGLDLGLDVVVTFFDATDYDPPIRHPDPSDLGPWLVDHSALFRWIFLRTNRQGIGDEDGGGDNEGGSGPESDPESDVVAAYTLLAELGRRHGFDVLTTMFMPEERDRRVGARIEALGLPVVGLSTGVLLGQRGVHDAPPCDAVADEQALFIPVDGHLSVLGNRQAACVIESALRQIHHPRFPSEGATAGPR